ncbi:MAG: hypothetical protein LH650_15650, partial [Chloroflexi bacterium]|nr:hypothetical protein [Chloroflexota bacterium]
MIRLLAGLAMFLVLGTGVPGIPTPAGVAARTPSYDVRGVWQWEFTYTCAGCTGTLYASVTIERQDRRTGAVRGSYSLAAGEVGGIRNPPYDTTIAGT